MKTFNIIMNIVGGLLVILSMILYNIYGQDLGRAGLSYFLLAIYVIPGLIAGNRNTKNQAQVWIINIFLGRTFVGWVVALTMACTNNVYQKNNRKN